MKIIIALLTILMSVVFMVGCENSVNPINSDNPTTSIVQSENEGISLAKKAENGENNRWRNHDKVEICHLTGNGYKTIEVDENAVQAHLDQGDMLPNWVLTGEWVFAYNFDGTLYSHDYNFDTGTGGYPAGDYPYSHPELILSQWPAVACDGGNIVEFEFVYTDDADNQEGLILWATGYIDEFGTMTGELWRSDTGVYPVSWTATGGTIEKECVLCQEQPEQLEQPEQPEQPGQPGQPGQRGQRD